MRNSMIRIPLLAALAGIFLATGVHWFNSRPVTHLISVDSDEPGVAFAVISPVDFVDGTERYRTPRTFEIRSDEQLQAFLVSLNVDQGISVTVREKGGRNRCGRIDSPGRHTLIQARRSSCTISSMGLPMPPGRDAADVIRRSMSSALAKADMSVDAIQLGGSPDCAAPEALQLFRDGELSLAREACMADAAETAGPGATSPESGAAASRGAGAGVPEKEANVDGAAKN